MAETTAKKPTSVPIMIGTTAGKAKSKAESKSLSIKMFGIDGKEQEPVTVSEAIFGQKENKALISQYIRVYLQNQRMGTASAKKRGEVIGSTRKIYKQKGTGGARHGSRKASLFRGGGVTFGPLPRDYSLDMNKKQKKQALFISLSMKMKEHAIMALDGATIAMKPKTKEVSAFLKSLKIDTKKVLVVLPEVAKNGLLLSARNIPNVEIMQSSTVNPYAVLNNKTIVFVGDALKTLEKHFLAEHESN